MAGEWVGRGMMRQNAEAAPERVYCRVTNSLDEAGTTLTQKGRCAVGNNTATISGRIVAEPDGTYSGALATPQMETEAALAGTVAEDDALSFTASYVDARSKAPATATVTMRTAEGAYQLLVERDGFQPTDIVFTVAPPGP